MELSAQCSGRLFALARDRKRGSVIGVRVPARSASSPHDLRADSGRHVLGPGSGFAAPALLCATAMARYFEAAVNTSLTHAGTSGSGAVWTPLVFAQRA